ncbi:hypothetical protein C8R42DRAFT_719793 [Lentinula raphanica]|nr:hypothetical protein C8R42DRAFT_719793 [Lentinula raphanica]
MLTHKLHLSSLHPRLNLSHLIDPRSLMYPSNVSRPDITYATSALSTLAAEHPGGPLFPNSGPSKTPKLEKTRNGFLSSILMSGQPEMLGDAWKMLTVYCWREYIPFLVIVIVVALYRLHRSSSTLEFD